MVTRIETLRADQLRARGIEASLIGSLKTGGYGMHSDIDILVSKCPRDLVYCVEAELEDIMNGLPFDMVYLELLPQDQRERWLDHAR